MIPLKTIDTTKIGFFRFKKFNETTYLITNDVGKFHFLSNQDFQSFISGNIEILSTRTELEQKGFIKTPDYEEKMRGSYMLKNHFLGLGPALMAVVTTLRCNHKCKYCHAAVAPMEAVKFDMTQETAQKAVDSMFYTNNPNIVIEFQGGESLVNYPIVQYIVEYASVKAKHLQKNLYFSLVSNLTLMTEEKLTWLLDHGVDICTSLDGTEKIHNYNRSGYEGNSYQDVTYWMKRVSQEKQKRGMGNVNALLTVTKETLKDSKSMVDTYLELGLDGIFLRWLNPYGFAAADLENLSYHYNEWIQFYKNTLDYIIEINKTGRMFRENITCVYLKKIFSVQDPGFMDIRSPSGIATGCVAYNYDGKIYASDESRMLGRMGIDDFYLTEVGDDGETTYKNMMQADITKIAIQSSCLDGLAGYNDHVYKPYLGVDIIHNFKMTGNIYTPLAKDEKMKLQIAILDYIFEKLQDDEVKRIFMSWIS